MNAIGSTIGLFALIAGAGAGLAATKFIAEHRVSDSFKIGRIIPIIEFAIGSFLIVCAIFMYFMSNWLAISFFDDAALAPFFKIGILWLFGFVYVEFGMAVLGGFEDFFSGAITQVIRGVILVGGTWIGLTWGGLQGAIWAMVASVIISSLMVILMINKRFKKFGIKRIWNISFLEAGPIWKYSLSALGAGLVTLPFHFLANGFIARNVGMRELGILNAVNTWRAILTFLPVTFSKVSMAIISNQQKADNNSLRSFEISTWLNQILLWPVAMFMLCGAKKILQLNGNEFIEGAQVFQIMIGGTALGFVGNSFGTIIQSKGWFGIGILGNLLTGLSIGLFTWAFAGVMGAEAMSWGFFIGYSLNLLFTCLIVSRKLKLPNQLLIRMLGGGVAMGGFTCLVTYNFIDFNIYIICIISLLAGVFASLIFVPSFIIMEKAHKFHFLSIPSRWFK